MYTLCNILIAIKNKATLFKNDVYVMHSKFIYSIVLKLKETGHIKDAKIINLDEKNIKKLIHIRLVFPMGVSSFKHLAFLSKPGRVLFVSYDKILSYVKDKRTILLSTSIGILTHREALNRRVGGVLLFKI